MALINLNDTTPAAPAGKVNVKWQADALAPRNVSAYIDPATLGPTPIVEAPAGTLDGTNTVFTLSFTPQLGSLFLSLNGVEQCPGFGAPLSGADYTISGATITYVVPPRAADEHTARYTH